MNEARNVCPICGGKKIAGTTTFSADLGTGVVVVRDVRATICSQCGEEWIDETAKELECMVDDARTRKLQVEVVTMK